LGAEIKDKNFFAVYIHYVLNVECKM